MSPPGPDWVPFADMPLVPYVIYAPGRRPIAGARGACVRAGDDIV